MWEKPRNDIYEHTDRVYFAGQVTKVGISLASVALCGSRNLVDENNIPV